MIGAASPEQLLAKTLRHLGKLDQDRSASAGGEEAGTARPSGTPTEAVAPEQPAAEDDIGAIFDEEPEVAFRVPAAPAAEPAPTEPATFKQGDRVSTVFDGTRVIGVVGTEMTPFGWSKNVPFMASRSSIGPTSSGRSPPTRGLPRKTTFAHGRSSARRLTRRRSGG